MNRAKDLRASVATLRSYADRLEQQADRLEQQAERAARRPIEPAIEPGRIEVIVFSVGDPVRPQHVAVGQHHEHDDRVRWAVVNPETALMTWDRLLDTIGESNWDTMRVVTETGPLQRLTQGETQ